MNDTKATQIFQNACLITMENQSIATAMAIVGDTILWIGDIEDADKFADEKTKWVDLEGAFVYPGFIDAHAHILYSGIKNFYLSLHHCRSKEEVLKRVQEHHEKHPNDEWILGYGWDDHEWCKKVPLTAQDLDRIAPYKSVFLRRNDTHFAWVNSKALMLAGISAHTESPAGGKIIKDERGEPTGLLVDRAIHAIEALVPEPSFEKMVELSKEVLQECNQKGITSLHNASTYDLDLKVFQHLYENDQLSLRLSLMIALRSGNEELFDKGPINFNSYLQMSCIKLWMDGALGSRGAALIEPYSDDPTHSGLILWEEMRLLEILNKAKEKGYQVAIHAIGDKANHLLLNCYEEIGVKNLRWRIEHTQQLLKEDIHRFAELDIIASMQPLHLVADMPWLKDRLGTKRVEEGSFMMRSLWDHGTLIIGGSDAPVVDFNPLWGIYAACTRQNFDQEPKEGFFSEQRLTREEALKMYTVNAAYAAFQEDKLGSLVSGKFADFVVLDKNLLTCSDKEILETKVIATYVGGKRVF